MNELILMLVFCPASAKVGVLAVVGLKNKAQFIDIFRNWRLALLGATGLVLSLASGWTTWDGMRNFTNEPILSLMITFGIQGVMLIVAWLIGESFATSIGRGRQERRQPFLLRFLIVAIWLALFVLLGLLLALLLGFDVEALLGLRLSRAQSVYNGEYLLIGIMLSLFTLPILSAGKDIIEKYQQAARVIARNLSLWLMFLACMGASVFFSFDSLFTAIFPQNERVRAADIRIRTQVAAISANISELNTRRRLEARTKFLASKEWENYSGNLDRLVVELRNAPGRVDQYLRQQSKRSQKTSVQREEELALLRGQLSQLLEQKAQLSERVLELKNQTAVLNTVVKDLNAQIFAKNREVIVKTSQARAEETGISGTLQAGRGPKYRVLAEQLQRLKGQRKNLQAQLKAYQKQLTIGRSELAAGEGELARIDAQLPKLRGQSQLIGEASEMSRYTQQATLFKKRVKQSYQKLNNDRIAFEQTPERKVLAGLQSRCAKITDLLAGSPFIDVSLSSRSCDPGKAHEAASNLYALNGGAATLAKSCTNQSSSAITSARSIEQKLTHAHQCLRGSGLSAEDRTAMGNKIDAFERNRDDKAHRFVVSLNAFKDGNKLAYLALAIAFAIDSLVFVSGLFGANVLRSPLSNIPQGEGRTARQLDRMIENALLPDVYANATLALQAIKPVRDAVRIANSEDDKSVWTHELDLHARPHAAEESLRKLINAGAIIGSVKRTSDHMEKYLIRGELIEALSDMAMRAFEGGYEISETGDLKRAVINSLGPDVPNNALIALSYIKPSTNKPGFSAMLRLSEVRAPDEAIVRQCLNAASIFDNIEVVGNQDNPDLILIGKEFYRILADLAESAVRTPTTTEEPSSWSPPILLHTQTGNQGRERETILPVEADAEAENLAKVDAVVEVNVGHTASPGHKTNPIKGVSQQLTQDRFGNPQNTATTMASANKTVMPSPQNNPATSRSGSRSGMGAAARVPEPVSLSVQTSQPQPTPTPLPQARPQTNNPGVQSDVNPSGGASGGGTGRPAAGGGVYKNTPGETAGGASKDKPPTKPKVKPVSAESGKNHQATISNDTITFD